MGNKYSKQSKEAQAKRIKEKACGRKKKYATEEEAYQEGQRTYKCPHCSGWHRSGALRSEVVKARKKRGKKK